MKPNRNARVSRPPVASQPAADRQRRLLLDAALSEKQAGRLDAAETQLRAVVARHPDFAAAQVNLAEVLRQQGQFEPALEYAMRGVALGPQVLEGRIIRGMILAQLGQFDGAIEDLALVVTKAPLVVALQVILGDLLLKRDRLDEALQVLQKAQRIEPRNAGAAANLGTVLHRLGRRNEAAASYRRALTLDPGDARTHSNLAGLLSETGHVDAAIAAARAALAHAPGSLSAHMNLAAALNQKGDIEAAIATYRHVLALQPGHAEALAFLCHLRQHACDWEGLAADQEALRTKTYALGHRVTPFNVITALPDPREHLRCARLWASAFRPAATGPLTRRVPAAAATPRRPLRLGYLSGDFHTHATAMLIAEMFERHDRTRFKLLGYSLRRDSGDGGGSALRRRIVAGLDTFVDVSEGSSLAAAQRIAADDIDILIDLKGYTIDARSQILALRPAPLQVAFLGYPATMGAPFIDYIIADAIVAPMAHAPLFDEKIVHLPHCYQPNDRHRAVAAIPSRAECGLPDEAFVFCCINNSYKITPAVFDIWMRLLLAVPGAVLWLFEGNAAAARNLRRQAFCRGVEPARLVFAPRIAPERHIARLACADLFLDTLPVNAHTTASEALWAGLPVLTCLGEAFIARVAASLLTAIGLPELITTSLADYEAAALRLAHNPPELAALRQRLQNNRLTAPLFDAARFTRNFEAALLQMAELAAEGISPQAFAVCDPDHAGDAVPRPSGAVS